MTRLSGTTQSTSLAASTAKSQSDRDQDRRDATVASDLLATQFSSLLAARIQTLTNQTPNTNPGDSTTSRANEVSRRHNQILTTAPRSARTETSDRGTDRSAALTSAQNPATSNSSDTKQHTDRPARFGEKPNADPQTSNESSNTPSLDGTNGRTAESVTADPTLRQADNPADVQRNSIDRDVTSSTNESENGSVEPQAASDGELATATGDASAAGATASTTQIANDSAATVEGAVETAELSTGLATSNDKLSKTAPANTVSQTGQFKGGETANTGVTEVPTAVAPAVVNGDSVQLAIQPAAGTTPGAVNLGDKETKTGESASASGSGELKNVGGNTTPLTDSSVTVEVVAAVEAVSTNLLTPAAATELPNKTESENITSQAVVEAGRIPSQPIANATEVDSSSVADSPTVAVNAVTADAGGDVSVGSDSTGSQSEQNGGTGSSGDDTNARNGFVPASGVHQLANDAPAAFLAGLFNAGVVASGSASDSSVATARRAESSTSVQALSSADITGSAGNRVEGGHLTHGGGFVQQTHGTAISVEQAHKTAPSELVARVTEGVRQSLRTGNELRITLAPEELGRVHINVTSTSGVVSAQIEAQTAVGHATLLENLSQLKDALVQQGIAIDRLEVTRSDRSDNNSDQRSGSGSSGSGAFGNGQQSRQEFAGRRELQVPAYTTGGTAQKSGQKVATPHSQLATNRRLDIQA